VKHLLSVLLVFIVFSFHAKAEEIAFGFRGTVHELDGEFSYFSGQQFEIVYSFERATDDANPDDPESGSYIGAIKSGSLTIFCERGNFRWDAEPDGPYNFIEVKNHGTADSYSASVSVSGPVDGSEIPAFFIIELIDGDAAALSNDTLPLTLEIPSFNHQRVVKFTFIGLRQYAYSALGIITSGNTPIRH
jgi:hypothetical protein